MIGINASKSDSTIKNLEADWRSTNQEYMNNLSSKGARSRITRAGEAYSGELSAGENPYEAMAAEGLGKYLASQSPTSSSLYKNAEGAMGDIMSGNHDVMNDPAYQGQRNILLKEMGDAEDAMASRRAAGNTLYGGGYNKEVGDLRAEMINQLMANSINIENNRMGQAQGAMGFLSEGEALNRNRSAAGLELGGYIREMEQQAKDREYNEWMRQLNDLGIPLDLATAMSTYKPMMGVESEARAFGAGFGGGGGGGVASAPAGSVGNGGGAAQGQAYQGNSQFGPYAGGYQAPRSQWSY